MKPKCKLNRVPLAVSIHWRYLHQDQNKTWREISGVKKYGKYSKATICRHMKRPIEDTTVDKRKNNKGRPPKLTVRDKRNILRQVEILRRDYGYFTTKRLKVFAGVSPDISDETVRRVLRKAGFKYSHSRKKGVLSRKDLKVRYEFAKKVRRSLTPSVWTDHVAFYLDGVGFTHKVNPHDQSLAPRTMSWRKPSDGLSYNQTAKGSHAGSGGRTANFLVAIAYKRGVVLVEQYEGQLNGQKITHETYSQFCERAKQTLLSYSPEIIDKTIASMDKRIDMVKKAKGQRIKY
eukprot:gene10595-11716_t